MAFPLVHWYYPSLLTGCHENIDEIPVRWGQAPYRPGPLPLRSRSPRRVVLDT